MIKTNIHCHTALPVIHISIHKVNDTFTRFLWSNILIIVIWIGILLIRKLRNIVYNDILDQRHPCHNISNQCLMGRVRISIYPTHIQNEFISAMQEVVDCIVLGHHRTKNLCNTVCKLYPFPALLCIALSLDTVCI